MTLRTKSNSNWKQFLCYAAALPACLATAHAELVTWTGEGTIDTFWSDADNWDPAGVPGVDDEALFSDVIPSRVSFQGNFSVGTLTYTSATSDLLMRAQSGTAIDVFTVGTVNMAGTGLEFYDFNSVTSRRFGVVISDSLNLAGGLTTVGSFTGLSGGFSAAATEFSGGSAAILFDFEKNNYELEKFDLGAVSMVDESPVPSFDYRIALQTTAEDGDLYADILSGGGDSSRIELNGVSAGDGRLILEGNQTAVYDGEIRDGTSGNSLGLVMQGSGAQTLTNTNDYSGGTTIDSGTLALSGSATIGSGDVAVVGGTLDISALSSGGYTLVLTQQLSGAGTIIATGKTLTVEGILAPGNSIGTLTIEGGELNISAVDTLVFELGATNDAILLTNGATLDLGVLDFSDFDFLTVEGFNAGTFTLLSGWAGLSGSLGETTGLVDGLDASLALDGNGLVLTVVPEPGLMAGILGLAALSLLVVRIRRKRL